MNTLETEAQIAAFIDKYTPEIAAQLRIARAHLRALFPRGFELVYDNYNALVFGISATGRTSDAFVSVTAYPKWITLFFLHGGTLHDPQGLLEGSGKQVRGVRLNAPDDINSAPILALLDHATRAHAEDFAAAPTLSTVIKVVAAKQRPRRPAASTRAPRSGKASSVDK